jgi:hypothetical protein
VAISAAAALSEARGVVLKASVVMGLPFSKVPAGPCEFGAKIQKAAQKSSELLHTSCFQIRSNPRITKRALKFTSTNMPLSLPHAIAAREANCCGLRTRKALRLALDPRDSLFAHLAREFGGVLAPAAASPTVPAAPGPRAAAASPIDATTPQRTSGHHQDQEIPSSSRSNRSSPAIELIPGEASASMQNLIAATPPRLRVPTDDVACSAMSAASHLSPGKFSNLLFSSPAKGLPASDRGIAHSHNTNDDISDNESDKLADADAIASRPRAPAKLVELFDHEFAVSQNPPHAVPLEDDGASSSWSPPGASSGSNHALVVEGSVVGVAERLTSVVPLPPLVMDETVPQAQREFQIVIPDAGTARITNSSFFTFLTPLCFLFRVTGLLKRRICVHALSPSSCFHSSNLTCADFPSFYFRLQFHRASATMCLLAASSRVLWYLVSLRLYGSNVSSDFSWPSLRCGIWCLRVSL